MSENTINVAEEAARKYGRLVYCTFDDEKFKICVPASNRKKIMHQALVTGFNYGVFVVAKVEEGEGALIQTVVVKILDAQKEAHATPLKTIGKALLGWIYDPNLLSKGYLLARDCPKWMTMMQQHNCVFRYKLWAAHYNRVKGDGECYKPTYPVSMYKHSQQYNYNKGKWGLYKNSEMTENVNLVAKVPFESKYILRMIDAIVVNHFRCEQARTIVKPFVSKYKSNNNKQLPTPKII